MNGTKAMSAKNQLSGGALVGARAGRKSRADTGERIGKVGGGVIGGVATENPAGAEIGAEIGGKVGRRIGEHLDALPAGVKMAQNQERADRLVAQLSGGSAPPSMQERAEQFVGSASAQMGGDSMRGVDTPVSAGRSRLSLQNGSLANSSLGTEQLSTLPVSLANRDNRLSQGTPNILNNEQAGPDWCGRISGDHNRAKEVLQDVVAPSPRRESDRNQSAMFSTTASEMEYGVVNPSHRIVDKPTTSLGKLVEKIRIEQARGQ